MPGRTHARPLSVAVLLVALSAFAGDKREPAPRFNNKSLDGETFSNESLTGKVVLLQFWNPWCPYCRSEESLVNDLNQEFADKGLIVLAVDVGEPKKKVKKYLDQHPCTPRILTDDTNLAAMYAANSYPIYVVIDRDGNIAGTQHGAGGERALRNLLTRAGVGAEDDDN
jgi:thiol-disulfide isomerase/thioredoxin